MGDNRISIQHSFTSLKQFDDCPEAMRSIYVLKRYKKTYTPAITGGIDEHRALEQRIRYHQLLPEQIARAESLVRSLEQAGKIEVELSLAVARDMTPIGFWDGWLRGKYDVVTRWSADRRAFIGDWKTGKVREASDQLEIGAMLLMANDPAIDSVTGANLWLQTNSPGIPYTFHRRNLESLWLKWSRRMLTIESTDLSEPWERRESGLCGYCPVQDCPHYRGG